MTYNDTHYNIVLRNASVTFQSQNITNIDIYQTQLSNGTYNYILNFLLPGIYVIFINFTQYGYMNQTIILSVLVWAIGNTAPTQPYNTLITNNATTIASQWGNNHTIILTYYDPTNSIFINNVTVKLNVTKVGNVTIIQFNGYTIGKFYFIDMGNGS